MTFEKDDIQKIAKLAKLSFQEKELEGFVKDMNTIMEYVSQLSRVETEGVTVFFDHIDNAEQLRSDEVSRPEGSVARAALLENASQKTDEYIKAPAVF